MRSRALQCEERFEARWRALPEYVETVGRYEAAMWLLDDYRPSGLVMEAWRRDGLRRRLEILFGEALGFCGTLGYQVADGATAEGEALEEVRGRWAWTGERIREAVDTVRMEGGAKR